MAGGHVSELRFLPSAQREIQTHTHTHIRGVIEKDR